MNNVQLIKGITEISHAYKNYFFDLDGVLWRGQQSVPGSIEAMKFLRKQNKRLFFITNSSVRSRKQLQNRFTKYGLQVQLSQCYPSTYFSGLYLRQRYPLLKNVLCFGTHFLEQQLLSSGLNVKRIVDLPVYDKPIEIANNHIDQSIQAVVVGWDSGMTYSKSCLIGFQIQKGAKFFGTNPDKYTMVGGYKIPCAGSIIASVQQATGIKAEIIGKPNTFVLDHLIQKYQLNREECIMIGDNLSTDILFGNKAGISTYCVLTGVSQQKDVLQTSGINKPTFYSQNLTLQDN